MEAYRFSIIAHASKSTFNGFCYVALLARGSSIQIDFWAFACKILHFDVRQGEKLEDREKHINFVLTVCEHHKIATQTGGFLFISSDLFWSAMYEGYIFIEISSPFFVCLLRNSTQSSLENTQSIFF